MFLRLMQRLINPQKWLKTLTIMFKDARTGSKDSKNEQKI